MLQILIDLSDSEDNISEELNDSEYSSDDYYSDNSCGENCLCTDHPINYNL